MSAPRLVWQGEVDGALHFPGADAPPVRSVEELAQGVRDRGASLDDAELDLLGGFALFLCIRGERVGRAGLVLPRAERHLDAACRELFAGDDARERVFRHGADALLEHLHPTRSEPHHVLAYLGLLALERRLEAC